MIGKPGCTVFQMNMQPTAQNTRECGANGELAAFLTWANPNHVAKLAAHLKVAAHLIPHYAPPTHIMAMMRHGGGDAPVSLGDRDEPRRIASGPSPGPQNFENEIALRRGERRISHRDNRSCGRRSPRGPLGREDRRVHECRPDGPHLPHSGAAPGRARSDFDILVDFAGRMDLRDAAGAPLIKCPIRKGLRPFQGTDPGKALRLHRLELKEINRRVGEPVAL